MLSHAPSQIDRVDPVDLAAAVAARPDGSASSADRLLASPTWPFSHNGAVVTTAPAETPAEARWADQTWVARGVIVLAVASLAFEQSPANEAIRANLAFRVLDHTGNALAVGITVLLITLVIEGLPGVLITAGLHLNPGLTRRLMRKAEGDIEQERLAPKKSAVRKFGSTLTDIGIALGIGAGLVVVKRRFNEPDRSVRQDLVTCAKATLVVAVVSGFIAWLIAGGLAYAEDIGLERFAELVIDYAVDWRFWFIVIICVQGASWIAGRIKRATTRSGYQPRHLKTD